MYHPPYAPPARVPRLAARVGLTLALAGLVTLLAAGAAEAQGSANGPQGQTLTVSKVTGLSHSGETVTVRGSGYDEDKGIYVAYCVDNGPGATPTPCGGGADTTGSLGVSHWISSNPPSYAGGLTIPYEPGGSFTVSLAITPRIGEVDCTVRTCAVVTRADHTRSGDRSQDVLVPVSFAGGTQAGGPDPAAPGTTQPDSGPATPTPAQADSPASTPPTVPPSATPYRDALDLQRVSDSSRAAYLWLAGVTGIGLLGALVGGRLVRRRSRR